jgi:Transposase DDE domain
MGTMFGFYPFLRTLYADSGYQGAKFHDGLKAVCGHINLEIVKPSELHKFFVLPKRRIVERTIGRLNQRALAFLRGPSIRPTLRKLCQPSQ